MSFQDRIRGMKEWQAIVDRINEAVLDDEYDLTEWESNFIESVQKALDAGRPLTTNQDARLTEIWEKATG